MERWEGKVAVVTGASAGIGKAVTKALLERGVTVVGVARGEPALKKLAAEVKTYKGAFHPKVVDITSEEQVIALFSRINARLGGVDILVNNAGTASMSSLSVGDGKTLEWRNMLDVFVVGLSTCTREALKSMKRNMADGHIININSMAGHTIHDLVPPMYTASKHAVTVLTEALRREVTKNKLNIRVTSISPGHVRTEKNADVPGMADLPALEVRDVADAVIFVLSQPQSVGIDELTLRPVGGPV